MPKVEGYMFEEHDMIRAAATECMCNLALSTEVLQYASRFLTFTWYYIATVTVRPGMFCLCL